MGIDPDTPAHVVDAVDHQLEEAVERIASMIRVAQRDGGATDITVRTRMLDGLQRALQRLEQTVARVDALETSPELSDDLPLDELTQATTQAAKAVEGAEATIATLEEPAPSGRRRP
jgi:hypothetical protein